MTFLEEELLKSLERLEAHYQERERVLEQNLRGLRAQVETLARQVNTLQQHLSALERQAHPLPPAPAPSFAERVRGSLSRMWSMGR